jgi:hypothetical protein
VSKEKDKTSTHISHQKLRSNHKFNVILEEDEDLKAKYGTEADGFLVYELYLTVLEAF